MHHTLSDYLLDLVQNSVEAKSTLVIVDFLQTDEEIKIYIADNGTGMDEETLKRVRDPFCTDGQKHKHRNVGLGISFLAQLASQCEGHFDITSEKGLGTSLLFCCPGNHLDVPPIGNLASTVLCCMSMRAEYELKFHRQKGSGSYTVLRSQLIDSSEDFEDGQLLVAARSYLKSLEEDLL